ncbi:MAG: tripartite tricarboxylate transporter TctB family protein [Alicyclobacillus macrosporangiidus]|uniref:tripartite tricarboxylate transporter TctB family protein n=1 Tax=Alicyclobacillus macrosporangiidus TaxID=392015 RepID=UPI0026EEBC65|nr:tripartite tricarboxylate transporter TctB family protein [Alicyclobacillus macrosporangiidus]MCL6598134.1 tripartite tricarboxylate transporter TctB family protein [Alicyclobacillus macrosporangiidus]
MKTARSVDIVLFDAVLLVAFIAFAVLSSQYQPAARELPLPVSVIGAILTFVLLLADAIPVVSRALSFVHRRGMGGDVLQTVQTVSHNAGEGGMSRSEWWHLLRLTCWLAAYVAALKLIGYLMATAAFVFLLTLLEGRLSWWKAGLSAAGTTLCFYVLFHVFLSMMF